jgi:outer membrane protein assembly factor BamB
VTDPREPHAAGVPEQQGSDAVTDGVDDPRFPLLDAEWPEYGLRIDPATGMAPPPVEPAPGPAVVHAPGRRPVGDERRSVARLVTVGAVIPALVVAAIAGLLIYRSTEGSGTAAHHVGAVSRRPPVFTVSTAVSTQARADGGLAVTPAGNGGLWYQASGHDLTRLAAADGNVNYRFPARQAAIGLAVAGQSVLAVTETAAGSVLVSRDRGSGKVTSRVPLPGSPACGAFTAACDPAVADGAAWIALDDGVARVDGGRATLIPVPGARAIASGGRLVWALTDDMLYRLDPATGRIAGRSSLHGAVPSGLAAGAGAVWVAATRDGKPVVLRFDGPPGRRPLAIPMPSAVRAIAASDGAVWVALDGGGVRELDPSRNRLAGTTIDLPDQDALLSTRPGQIWAVRVDGGTAALTRIDLTTAQ